MTAGGVVTGTSRWPHTTRGQGNGRDREEDKPMSHHRQEDKSMSDTQRETPGPVRKKAISCPRVLNEAYDYTKPSAFSRGIRVDIGPCTLLFISGTASVDERGESVHVGDFRAQAWRTFRNIQALLESEGATWHDVVRTTCYLADMRYYDEFNEVRNAFYQEQGLNPFPASTGVQAVLCRPELLVEIEAIAVLPSQQAER